jgi:hypothetical protein
LDPSKKREEYRGDPIVDAYLSNLLPVLVTEYNIALEKKYSTFAGHVINHMSNLVVYVG